MDQIISSAQRKDQMIWAEQRKRGRAIPARCLDWTDWKLPGQAVVCDDTRHIQWCSRYRNRSKDKRRWNACRTHPSATQMEEEGTKAGRRKSKLGLLPSQIAEVAYSGIPKWPKYTTFIPVFTGASGQSGIPGILTLLKVSDSIYSGVYAATHCWSLCPSTKVLVI